MKRISKYHTEPERYHTGINKGLTLFFACCILWWIGGSALLFLSDKEEIYRYINIRHSRFLDGLMPLVSDMGTAPLIIGACLLLIAFRRQFRSWGFVLMALLCNGIPFLVCRAIKYAINAPRPLGYFNKAEWMHLVKGQPEQYYYSFPSGHTAGAFAFYCFLSLLLPDSKRYMSILFFFIAMAVAYSRIYLSQHFYDDVYAGSMVGALTCLCVFLLLRRVIPVYPKTAGQNR